ncbi:glyoxalase [Mycobacterium sp. 852013-50091_SCH5140682]|uniref:VOC family protein n=1 Tax=Mycobacterium sp. 852013-50091_SCH5140682 TaxID=1834109 RepID=UPI0007EA4C36|nr:VOC family protein [Mycobacterium sp. 852013-50091_SCH5140682]OBC16359.1 glyoxalase [Mycobacterium sp. 852013-50091_SCH5140682]
MTLHVEMVTVDCAEPESLAQWWAQALGGTVNAAMPGEFIIVESPDGPKLGFQHVEDPTPGKNRVHLDFHAADMEAEVARLVGLGASETGRHSFGDAFSWVVLADPAGNAFCIAGQ